MAQVNIKVDDQLKKDVSKIFDEMGLDLTTGIKIYLKKVQQEKRIPFNLESNQSKLEQLAQRYQAGDQKVVSTLNGLFNTLEKQKHSQGIGDQMLNKAKTDESVHGIGNTILNHRN